LSVIAGDERPRRLSIVIHVDAGIAISGGPNPALGRMLRSAKWHWQ
jgi:hypothetical protein